MTSDIQAVKHEAWTASVGSTESASAVYHVDLDNISALYRYQSDFI